MARLNYVKSFRGTTKTESGNLTCGKCRKAIEPGMPYQWWANRSPGMRGGSRRVRCMDCTPTLAERTPGRRGQWMMMEAALEEEIAVCATFEDLEATAQSVADQIREFAQEFIDGADNMESGFGHETSTSAELRERGENIEAVADEIEQLSFDIPEEEDFDEDQVGIDLAQELFGIDDPDELDEDQRIAWTQELQNKRDEFDHQEITSEDEDLLEAEREKIREQLCEVDV